MMANSMQIRYIYRSVANIFFLKGCQHMMQDFTRMVKANLPASAIYEERSVLNMLIPSVVEACPIIWPLAFEEASAI